MSQGKLVRTLAALAVCSAIAVLGGSTASASADERGANDRIIGGNETSIANYPFLFEVVRDRIKPPDYVSIYDRHWCGGSLLTPRIVLTAAHCFWDGDPDCGPEGIVSTSACNGGTDSVGDGTVRMDANDVFVMGDTTNLSTTPEAGHRTNVQAINVSPLYDGNYLHGNDDTLLVLTVPVSNPTVKLAGPDEAALWAPGRSLKTAGWGANVDNATHTLYPDTLKEGRTVRVADNGPTCAAWGADFLATDMFCAQSSPDATCSGDSGGPIAAPTAQGFLRLVGITSWGPDPCSDPGYSSVYTRVAEDQPGVEYETYIQNRVDQLEATYGIPDAGSIVGHGATPPPDPAKPITPVIPAAACPKGKVLKKVGKGKKKKKKCVKKKRKKTKRKKK